MSEKGKKPEPVTLTDDDIVSSKRDVGRRSMVGMLGVGAAAGAVALATGCRRGVVVQTVATGYTDGDQGACADPGGGGRGNTGVTDADQHPCYDPPGRGRGVQQQVVVQQQPQTVVVQPANTGCTDSDPGDRAGQGVRCGGVRVQVQGTGITDNDGGPCADPAGGGRGNTGMTDSDGGGCADPAGRGRRGY